MTIAASNTGPTITPMMFSGGNKQLMGVHYSPSPRTSRGAGVLMCNQVGPDYAEYYKTGRMLVNMLVARGFDCMRFDYTGWGDSRGGFEEGSVRQWLSDIACAEAMLKDRAGCLRMCLCGFGFGGLLAAAHAATSAADAIVLWEPVLDGQSYCRKLRRDHKAWLRGSFVKAAKLDREFQAMGFPAAAELQRQMCRLRLGDLASCRAEKVFAVVQDSSPEQSMIAEHFGRYGIAVHTCDPGESLPLRPMRDAVAWLEEGRT